MTRDNLVRMVTHWAINIRPLIEECLLIQPASLTNLKVLTAFESMLDYFRFHRHSAFSFRLFNYQGV